MSTLTIGRLSVEMYSKWAEFFLDGVSVVDVPFGIFGPPNRFLVATLLLTAASIQGSAPMIHPEIDAWAIAHRPDIESAMTVLATWPEQLS